MNTIKYILLLVPILTFSQILVSNMPSNTIEAFHNTTWKWTDGTNIFELKLYDSNFMIDKPIDGEAMFLIYKMTDNSGNVFYESRQEILGSLPFGGILGAGIDSVPFLFGSIEDYSHSNNIYSIQGMLKIVYIPCQGSGCSPQISWKITKPKELVQDPSAPDDYNLPTDITLTKVN